MSNNNKDSLNQENKNFQFIINTQYLKDLSFENPKAPNSLKVFNSKPEIKIDVDIKSKLLKDHGEDIFEVDLMIKGSTYVEKEIMFVVEAIYSGIFTIKNAPNDVLEKVLLIEDVMDQSTGDNLGDLRVSKDEIIENVAEKILTQEKTVGVIDSNNKIINNNINKSRN